MAECYLAFNIVRGPNPSGPRWTSVLIDGEEYIKLNNVGRNITNREALQMIHDQLTHFVQSDKIQMRMPTLENMAMDLRDARGMINSGVKYTNYPILLRDDPLREVVYTLNPMDRALASSSKLTVYLNNDSFLGGTRRFKKSRKLRKSRRLIRK